MRQIIILTTLLINLISCNSQEVKKISNFDKLNKIQVQIENHSTNKKTVNSIISSKWIGEYYVDIPTTREYLQSVKLKISSDSCKYIVTGYAENKEYELSVIEKNDTLILKYEKLLKYESTYIENDNTLAKEKDFGYLIYDGKKYLWISPYLDYAYYNGLKHKQIIKKTK